MKRITVKTKHACIWVHDWRLSRTTKMADYYQCPFCESRRVVINDQLGGYQQIDHDWLNAAKDFKPWIDSYWFIRKLRYAIITGGLAFFLLLIIGLINDYFFNGGCNRPTEKVVNKDCMVLTKQNTWVNKELIKQ